MPRIAIVGGRKFQDYELMKNSIDCFPGDVVVSGGAIRADSLGARFAKENGLELVEYLPDWAKYGRRAGFVRNELIIKDSDVVYAFWDGKSKGTESSINLAKKHKKILNIITYSIDEILKPNENVNSEFY
jgi:GH18 family chitinase